MSTHLEHLKPLFLLNSDLFFAYHGIYNTCYHTPVTHDRQR